MIYDINKNQWETSQLKFRKRAYHNLNEYNDKIYILGGKKISVNGVYEYLDNTIEVFDINKQTISIDNTNPHQAADFASFTYGTTLIILGGSIKKNDDGIKEYTNKVHLYDLVSGFWYELESMPVAKETSGVLIQNKIFLFGGFNGKPLSTVESFDLITEKWNTEGNLFTTLSNPAISSKKDVVYLFENEKIYTYNIYTKELREYLINLPMKASKMFFLDDKLYILGGYIENYYSKYPSPNVFSIEIDEFKNTKPNRIAIIQSQ
jgi:N-acetylneuraminic acid mutarotase